MTKHHFVNVDGLRVFVREAGEQHQATIVLLHGYPSSSHMFRDLIPLLAERFHVIAPDMIGYGHSSAPSATEFQYTFDNLAAITVKALDQLGVKRFVLYMHDYGGPVGLRIATAAPARVAGLVVQNANAYLEGVSDAVAGLFMPLWKEQSPANVERARGFLTAEATKGQYTTGARAPERLNPDAWTLDQALLDRPGVDAAQLALFVDYQHNMPLYPVWQAYFREHQPRTLIALGKNDPFFLVAGADAYSRDLPKAAQLRLDGGHFALEEYASEIASAIQRVFAA